MNSNELSRKEIEKFHELLPKYEKYWNGNIKKQIDNLEEIFHPLEFSMLSIDFDELEFEEDHFSFSVRIPTYGGRYAPDDHSDYEYFILPSDFILMDRKELEECMKGYAIFKAIKKDYKNKSNYEKGCLETELKELKQKASISYSDRITEIEQKIKDMEDKDNE